MAYFKIVLIIIILLLGVYLILDYPMNQNKLIEFKEKTEGFFKNIYPSGQPNIMHNETFKDDGSKPLDPNTKTPINTESINTESNNTKSNNTGNTGAVNTEAESATNNIMKGINDDAMCEKESNGKCSRDVCGSDKLHPILDPKFNMRESSKQCLLLEDHLNNSKKRCFDCIRKHFLIIDGLLEEAISLEKDNTQRNHYRDLYLEWVKIEKKYAEKPTDANNIDDVSKMVRVFRKPLVEQYFDTISEYDIS